MVLLLWVLVMIQTVAWAGKVYRWTDSAGQVHFSDVPPASRSSHPAESVDLKPLAPVKGGEAKVSAASFALDGAKLWQDKCSACHHLGEGRESGKIGLFNIVVDSATGFPRPDDELRERLTYAVEGFTSDMDAVDISDSELQAVIRFLVEHYRK